ncbi:type II secretion system protein [Colwelliaceae bacterium 6441]
MTLKTINKGFTLIELMIVMSIMALLMGLVGPMMMNSLEKAQAKQELLTAKQWFKKISYRAFSSGEILYLELKGKKAVLYSKDNNKKNIIHTELMTYVFFQPQLMTYNTKGFVFPDRIVGTFKGAPMLIELNTQVKSN